MVLYEIDCHSAAGAVSLLLLGWSVAAPRIGWISNRIRLRKAPALVYTTLALISFLY